MKRPLQIIWSNGSYLTQGVRPFMNMMRVKDPRWKIAHLPRAAILHTVLHTFPGIPVNLSNPETQPKSLFFFQVHFRNEWSKLGTQRGAILLNSNSIDLSLPLQFVQPSAVMMFQTDFHFMFTFLFL